MAYEALKPLVMLGKAFQPGQVVPVNEMPVGLRTRITKKLVDQGRIIFLPDVTPAPKRRGRPPKARQLQEA